MKTRLSVALLPIVCSLLSACATTPLIDRLTGPKGQEADYSAAETEYKNLAPAGKAKTLESLKANLSSDCDYGMRLRPELGQLLGRDAVPALTELLVYTPKHRMYQCAHSIKAALEVLGSMGPEAEPAIPSLLRGASLIDMPGYAAATFRTMSASALSGIGDRAVPAITEVLDAGLEAGWPGPLPNWGWELNQKGNHEVMFVPAEETFIGILNAIGTPTALEAKKKYEVRARNQRRRENEATARAEKDAFEKHLAAAQRGDPESQNAVGVMYYQGNTAVKADRAKALSWFKKAARKDDASALRNICALMGEEISEKLAVGNRDVICVRHPRRDDIFPPPMFLGKVNSKREPLLVYVDRGWGLSGMYSQMQYMAKLLRIVQKYPIGIDAITVQTWLDKSRTRELAYTEAPWEKILFGDTAKLFDPVLRQAEKATGLKPVGMPEERAFQSEDEDASR